MAGSANVRSSCCSYLVSVVVRRLVFAEYITSACGIIASRRLNCRAVLAFVPSLCAGYSRLCDLNPYSDSDRGTIASAAYDGVGSDGDGRDPSRAVVADHGVRHADTRSYDAAAIAARAGSDVRLSLEARHARPGNDFVSVVNLSLHPVADERMAAIREARESEGERNEDGRRHSCQKALFDVVSILASHAPTGGGDGSRAGSERFWPCAASARVWLQAEAGTGGRLVAGGGANRLRIVVFSVPYAIASSHSGSKRRSNDGKKQITKNGQCWHRCRIPR